MPVSDPKTVKDLISYRLHVLANLSSRNVELRYDRKFGLKLLEWRAMALLGAKDGYSLKELGNDAGLDKGHASRTLTALINRGLAQKIAKENDKRVISISLTPAGRKLYESAFTDACARHRRWLSVLTPQQQNEFFELMALLTGRGVELMKEELRKSKAVLGRRGRGRGGAAAG